MPRHMPNKPCQGQAFIAVHPGFAVPNSINITGPVKVPSLCFSVCLGSSCSILCFHSVHIAQNKCEGYYTFALAAALVIWLIQKLNDSRT